MNKTLTAAERARLTLWLADQARIPELENCGYRRLSELVQTDLEIDAGETVIGNLVRALELQTFFAIRAGHQPSSQIREDLDTVRVNLNDVIDHLVQTQAAVTTLENKYQELRTRVRVHEDQTRKTLTGLSERTTRVENQINR